MAFCSDYFTETYRNFSLSMDRQQKITYLLDSVAEPLDIYKQLLLTHSEQVYPHEQRIPSDVSRVAHGLSQAEQNILASRPDHWEIRLLSTVLSDELDNLAPLRRDLDLELTFSPKIFTHNYLNWARVQFEVIVRFIKNYEKLFNIIFPETMGPKGILGSPDAILYLAKRMADGHRAAIEWALSWHALHAPEAFTRLASLCGKFARCIINGVEDFRKDLNNSVQNLKNSTDDNKTIINIEMKFILDEEVRKQIFCELAELNENPAVLFDEEPII